MAADGADLQGPSSRFGTIAAAVFGWLSGRFAPVSLGFRRPFGAACSHVQRTAAHSLLVRSGRRKPLKISGLTGLRGPCAYGCAANGCTRAPWRARSTRPSGQSLDEFRIRQGSLLHDGGHVVGGVLRADGRNLLGLAAPNAGDDPEGQISISRSGCALHSRRPRKSSDAQPICSSELEASPIRPFSSRRPRSLAGPDLEIGFERT